MLKLALMFFVLSLVFGVFGFSSVSTAAGGLARILFFVALAIFIICVALALEAGNLAS